MARDPAGTQRQGLVSRFGGFGEEEALFFPVLGRIEAVRCADTNKMAQTQVDVLLYGQRAFLYSVPLLHAKINAANGEDWTPEKGDLVVVVFLEGDRRRPIVIGYLPHPENTVESSSGQAPRYHRVRGETYETWDKDGNRTLHVGADDTVVVEGDGAVTVRGNLSITVEGDATVAVGGTTTVNSTGNVEVTAPLTRVTGPLTVTGNINSGAQISDVTGSMQSMRGTFNAHTHPENGDGGGTTSAPNQQM